MEVYAIMKNGKYVKDFTNGKKLTSNYREAERYLTSDGKKSAIIAAREYGKQNGAGYHVVRI